MDRCLLDAKYFEFMGRTALAVRKNDHSLERSSLRKAIVVERMAARAAVEHLIKTLAALNAARRALKKSMEQGVTFLLGESRVNQLREDMNKAREELTGVGEVLCRLLDMWQRRGATLQDLCNLCNRDYEQVISEIQKDRLNESFSGLIFVYNLDYKDPSNRGWIDYEVDAPLTHAIKEYHLHLMLHTPEGREISQKAFEECFPEIAKNALTLVTDADGVKHFIDKDGVEVGTVEEE